MTIECTNNGIHYSLVNDSLEVDTPVFRLSEGRIEEDKYIHETYVSMDVQVFPDYPEKILSIGHTDDKAGEVKTDKSVGAYEQYFRISKSVPVTQYSNTIPSVIEAAIRDIYGADVSTIGIKVTPTIHGIEGDFSVSGHELMAIAGSVDTTENICRKVCEFINENLSCTVSCTITGSFLNFTFSNFCWLHTLQRIVEDTEIGRSTKSTETAVTFVEYLSPNTNKPLHLGHLRNIAIGHSVAEILAMNSKTVVTCQVLNDKGVAICKSLVAWSLFGRDDNPERSYVKSDHFVGRYYVLFETEFQDEYLEWQKTPEALELVQNQRFSNLPADEFFKSFKNQYFNKYSKLGRLVTREVQRFEEGDPVTQAMLAQLNQWAIAGFDQTCSSLGIHFSLSHSECTIYNKGKQMITDYLHRGIFQPYGAEKGVCVDLTDVGLRNVELLRSDGTTLYITQDLALIPTRIDYARRHLGAGVSKIIYVVGDEQKDYFKGLAEISKRMGYESENGLLHHLSYGMVNLPDGRMKSREGNSVDIDTLLEQTISDVAEKCKNRTEIQELDGYKQRQIYHDIAIAALKFYLLKVGPQKTIIYNSKESIEFEGCTGPSIQYTCIRIRSILAKVPEPVPVLRQQPVDASYILNEQERDLILKINQYAAIIKHAGDTYDPSVVANYSYNLSKTYASFLGSNRIIENDVANITRLKISIAVLRTLMSCLNVMGIRVPEKM